MSSSSSAFSPDHHHHQRHSPSSSDEQLCYVHCNFCDTVLAVSVPCPSLLKTVTVRCGHCTNLLSVNMGGLVLPSPNQLHLGHALLSPHNLLEGIRSSAPNLLVNQPNANESVITVRGIEDLPKPPPVNRPPEKRQRVPSAYNRFIKDEIQRIKAGNPDISHREAFSAAAKNWAHAPQIHFGLMPDQPVEKTNVRQQEGEDVLMKDGFLAPPANMDDVISQAQSTRAALGSQSALFGDVRGKVKQLGDKFTPIRGLIGSIKRKKSRDNFILSAVIAACTLFLIIYWLSK